MTTATDILTLALKDANVLGEGQTPSATMMNDALRRCNWMIAEWNRKRWLIYHLVDISCMSDGRTTPYLVGNGADLNISSRPNRLEAAFLRQIVQTSPGQQVDYPLEILESWEDYSRIALKRLQPSFPNYIFYDTDWPIGKIYPYPFPQASIYEIHCLFKMVLSQFTSLTAQIILPDEYFQAIYLNMAVRLGVGHPISRDPTLQQQWNDLKGLARGSLNTLRTGNNQIARLGMPPGLNRPGIYNIYSDQVR